MKKKWKKWKWNDWTLKAIRVMSLLPFPFKDTLKRKKTFDENLDYCDKFISLQIQSKIYANRYLNWADHDFVEISNIYNGSTAKCLMKQKTKWVHWIFLRYNSSVFEGAFKFLGVLYEQPFSFHIRFRGLRVKHNSVHYSKMKNVIENKKQKQNYFVAIKMDCKMSVKWGF